MDRTLEVRLAGRLGGFALDVAFQAAPGVTALVGRSGAGKSSVLRCVAGLARVPGAVRLGDAVWQDARRFMAPHRRRVGLVFQGANLLPHLSVAANLRFAAARGAAPDLGPIVAATGIADLLDRRPAALSGGEAQRAALARALAGGPELLLLDEPFSALDREAREELADWLAALLPTLGLPVLLVSHDAAEVARLAARTVALVAGRTADDAALT